MDESPQPGRLLTVIELDEKLMTAQHLQTSITGATEAEHMQSVRRNSFYCCAILIPRRTTTSARGPVPANGL